MEHLLARANAGDERVVGTVDHGYGAVDGAGHLGRGEDAASTTSAPTAITTLPIEIT